MVKNNYFSLHYIYLHVYAVFYFVFYNSLSEISRKVWFKVACEQFLWKMSTFILEVGNELKPNWKFPITRWVTCAEASIRFGFVESWIVVDSHRIEFLWLSNFTVNVHYYPDSHANFYLNYPYLTPLFWGKLNKIFGN